MKDDDSEIPELDRINAERESIVARDLASRRGDNDNLSAYVRRLQKLLGVAVDSIYSHEEVDLETWKEMCLHSGRYCEPYLLKEQQ